MSCTVASDDQASSLRVKRKPAPPAAALVHHTLSLSSHGHPRPQHRLVQSIPQPSISERYPDPDPTDPFAPLWVLRNRTTSVSHTGGPPALEHLRQQTDEFGSRLGRSDRRHSTPYLLQSFSPTSTSDGHETITRSGHASEHGHEGGSMEPRTSSCVNGATGAGVARQRLFRPTRLSQITALALPSVSKGSGPTSPVSLTPLMHVPPISQPPLPSRADVEGSGTDSDSMHDGPLEAVEITFQASVQSRSQLLGETQEQERSKSGSANKITRFLRTRRISQVDIRPQTSRAAAADVIRIRKASISPPVTSTVVWAGRGQGFAPIKDHPLHRTAVPIAAPTFDVADVVQSPSQGEDLIAADMKTCSTTPEPRTPIQASVALPTSAPGVAAVLYSDTPGPPPLPPALAKHHSQTSHGHTDESHSSFSFVHVPSTVSSSSLAHFTQEHPYEAPASGRRPSTAGNGLGVCATIASSATMRMKRRSSLKFPLAHSAAPLSPLNSISTAKPLSPILSDSEPTVGEWDMPSLQALSKAASLPVIAESGVRVNFGSLFLQRKAVVVFIRHFWCPLCQDYMTSVASLNRSLDDLLFGSEEKDVSNEKALGISDDTYKERAVGEPVKLIIIGNGSHTMIGKYKQIFGAGAAGLEVYTDPSLTVYNALGMGRDLAGLVVHREGGLRKRRGSTPLARLDVATVGGNTAQKGVLDGNNCCVSKDRSDGGYVKHGLMGGIAMVFVRALKVGMPVWEKGGDLHQLGGEFVFGPGLTCAYAHRMQTTKGHAPFEDALHAAGVIVRSPSVRPTLQTKALEVRAREIEENPNPRSSKLQHSSVSGKKYNAPKLRSRGQTIDAIPIFAPVAEVPASASTPIVMSLSSGPARSLVGVSRERRESLRDRQKNTRVSSDEVPIVNPGPGVQKIAEQTVIDRQRGWNFPVTAPTSLNEPDWTENRHRSLRAIKERKNARRGLSSVDERQVISASISISKSHSRSLSHSGPHPSLCPMSQTVHSHQYERLKSRLNYESEFGLASASDWKPATKRRGRKGSVDVERGVQSDTNAEMSTVKGRRGDDVVSLARKMKVNLSRDHLAQYDVRELSEKDVGPRPGYLSR